MDLTRTKAAIAAALLLCATGCSSDEKDPSSQLGPVHEPAGPEIFAYGSELVVPTLPWVTEGKHWLDILAAEIDSPEVVTYGTAPSRILDVLSGLVNESPLPGTGIVPVNGAEWPGTELRPGLVVLDTAFDDVGHYRAQARDPLVPRIVSPAHELYQRGVAGMYRYALAVTSSETRIENADMQFTGEWLAGTNGFSHHSSGGTVAFGGEPDTSFQFEATPPQSGPLKGIVFISAFRITAPSTHFTEFVIRVDGKVVKRHTPEAWEHYFGHTGTVITVVPDVIPIELPVDGKPHLVRASHKGPGWFGTDCVYVPSEKPNRIAVMAPPRPVVGTWNKKQVDTWLYNAKKVLPGIRDVVAEFPNATWVPNGVTPEGLSADGIRPNEIGMRQRAESLIEALGLPRVVKESDPASPSPTGQTTTSP